jgi:8-oxo-dGTP diphosphatase
MIHTLFSHTTQCARIKASMYAGQVHKFKKHHAISNENSIALKMKKKYHQAHLPRNCCMPLHRRIHVLSRAVIFDQGHILLAYNPKRDPHSCNKLNKRFYYLPGGHVEFQESAQNALLREIQEEIGHTATIEKFLGVIEHAWHTDRACCHTHECSFIFKVHMPQIKHNDSLSQKEDHVALQWFAIKDLDSIDLQPYVLKKALPDWANNASENVLWSSIL